MKPMLEELRAYLATLQQERLPVQEHAKAKLIGKNGVQIKKMQAWPGMEIANLRQNELHLIGSAQAVAAVAAEVLCARSASGRRWLGRTSPAFRMV